MKKLLSLIMLVIILAAIAFGVFSFNGAKAIADEIQSYDSELAQKIGYEAIKYEYYETNLNIQKKAQYWFVLNVLLADLD